MAIKLPTLSPSKAGDLVCPKLFHTRHMTQSLPPESWSPHLAYGTAVHDALRDLYNPVNLTPPAERDVEIIVRKAFVRQQYPADAAEMREGDILRALRTVTNYRANDADIANTVAVERFEQSILGREKETPITLSVRFDRLIRRPETPGRIHIVDYKTGKPGTTDLDGATIALAVARAVIPGQYGDGAEAVLHFDFLSEEGCVHRETVMVAQVKANWKDLWGSALRIYYGGDHPAQPGPQCQFCPLRPQCQPGTAVVADADTLFD